MEQEKTDYFDCHVDTLTELAADKEDLNQNSCNLDLQRVLERTKRYVQIFAVYRDRAEMEEPPEEEFKRLYRRVMRLLEKEKAHLALCHNGQEMKQALQAGKAAAFLSIEDISIMGSCVTQMKELGFTMAMLTWNYENEYGAGAAYSQTKGLTEAGKRLAEELLRQGILLDISHLSDAGVEDILRMTERPVIASHSNVRTVCDNPRNLKKSQIREIIRRKGLIGVTYYSPFIDGTPNTTIQKLLRHMDAVMEQGGEEVLALGSDFDGCGQRLPVDMKGVENIENLKREMEKAGFGSRLIQKIFFENAYDFFDRLGEDEPKNA